MRKRRPHTSWSERKSSAHSSFGRAGTGIGVRLPIARLRPPRLRTINRSSRYTRNSRLWFTAKPPPRLSWPRPPPASVPVSSSGGSRSHGTPAARSSDDPSADETRPLASPRASPFFFSRSFNAALSSIASASRRFSLAFSPSRDRRRFASDTSRPPYLFFQL